MGTLGMRAMVFLLALGLPAVGRAEGGALDRYDPSFAGDAFLSVPDATVYGHLVPRVALRASYADEPLVLRNASTTVGEVVSHQMLLHAQASFALWHRVALDLDAPLVLSQSGDDPTVAGIQRTSPEDVALGDLRTQVRLAVLTSSGLVPSAAVVGSVWWPTGDEGGYSGSGEVRHGASVVLGADAENVRYRASLGRRAQPQSDPLAQSLGSDTTFGLAAATRVAPLWLGAELFGSTRGTRDANILDPKTTPLEALATARLEVGLLSASLGAGPGLTRAAGTPAFRVIASVEFSPSATDRLRPPPRKDETQGSARPPHVPALSALRDGSDRDGDGVPDAVDRCPDRAGLADAPAERRGCPADGDADGISDLDDACPKQPGVSNADPKRHGCPPDTDGDGIIDAEDACPEESGPRTSDPKTNGCPEAVRVEGKQIVIMEQVQFATGSDRIETVSHPLLGQVAKVLEQRPDIARVAVDGHTDNVGTEANNLALSRRRALAVLRWLVDNGVDERRLEARGFGPRQPIAANSTVEGRTKNRRVEFQIKKRTPLGERGWTDGAVED